MDRPRFKANLRLFAPNDAMLIALGELGHVFHDTTVLPAMAALIDGTRTEVDLAMEEAVNGSVADRWFALMEGESAGLLVDGAMDGTATAPEIAFWDTLCVPPSIGAARRAATTVSIVGVGPTDAAVTACREQAFLSAGLTLSPSRTADITVVFTDDYLRGQLALVNREHLQSQRPWMIVRDVGTKLLLGPVIRPGITACWDCLADRLRRNHELELFVQSKAGRPIADLCGAVAMPAVAAFVTNLAALEITRWTTGTSAESLEGKVLSYDVISGSTAIHDVTRRPQCGACGREGPWATTPVVVAPDSPLSPAAALVESLTRMRRHVSPVTGIISSVVPSNTFGKLGLYSFIARHAFPMVRENVLVLAENIRGRSGGAGFTEPEAEVGALGEAIERVSGTWCGEEESVVHSTARDLGHSVIPLESCLQFSEEQYATAAEWNSRQTSPRELVPVRLGDDQLNDWTPVWHLGSSAMRYLPSAYCYYGHPDAAKGFCFADSNGCAAGRTLTEAVRSGLFELIERDAVALWWYNRVRRPALNIDSFDLPFAERMRTLLADVGRDLVVLDVTSDLGVPVFAAVSARTAHNVEDVMLGFGAHTDPRAALLRALRELGQFYPIVEEKGADGCTIYNTANADAVTWLKQATRQSEPYLVPSEEPERSAEHFAPISDRLTAYDDVQTCVARLAAAGVDTFVLDQTRPDIGVPVCRVIAPGLRHFWRRRGPGRLYDVPAHLGWTSEATLESDLNPTAIFF